ncbi:uncharacterized protein FA14DRAFT_117274 [Meira miltonrushii]|uniref:NAD(P)-binding protein n=1 Tax=Meira miltonrushii TaxID=1280837 RepID=A0A316VGQ9_9BASI|nr:uncharacterized protein FA14DRAFT_117274 [Meira miltonrushii]PWN36700.1 hypothetical protein FA14DRAFT_117274 [Meira miltonrushii]
MQHVGRSLVHFLLNELPASQTKIGHIRIADKFLVTETARTIYVEPEMLKAMQEGRVEHIQANLNIQSTAEKMFEGPNGIKYDYVFDLSGEGIVNHMLPAQVLLERTTKLTGLLAKIASKKGVKAYIRDTPPFWLSKAGETNYSENFMVEQGQGAETARAYYYYEAERAAAINETLPLVILRSANVFGPHQYHGTVTPRIALGEVYAHLKEPFRLLWSADLRLHTLHSRDWCRGAWKAAEWMSSRSREEANKIAGESLPYIKPKDVGKIGEVVDKSKSAENASIENICLPEKTPIAPVFNLADQDDMTQGKILDVIGKVFDIQTGFTNAAINAWAKLNLNSVVDEANEKHTEAVAEIYPNQDPPIRYTPHTCYLGTQDLAQKAEALDPTKAEKILGWKAKEKFDEDTVKEVIQSFKDAGAWLTR